MHNRARRAYESMHSLNKHYMKITSVVRVSLNTCIAGFEDWGEEPVYAGLRGRFKRVPYMHPGGSGGGKTLVKTTTRNLLLEGTRESCSGLCNVWLGISLLPPGILNSLPFFGWFPRLLNIKPFL